jgi:CubicO group peptidase (beta-lactamase class C family)
MKRKIKLFLGALVFWFLIFLGWEWWKSYPRFIPVIPFQNASLESKVDSILLNSLKDQILPGITAAVVKDGKIIYLKAFGFANLQSRDSLKIDSKIQIGSVSKLFTALGIATYAHQNQITVSQPIYNLNRFSNLGLNPNLSFKKLLHQSAKPKNQSVFERVWKTLQSQDLEGFGEENLKLIQQDQPESLAQDQEDFLNLGGHLLSVASGKSFETLIQESIFSLSGMESTQFVNSWPADSHSTIGYKRTFLWKRLQPKSLRFSKFPSPSTGMITTPQDMSHALVHLIRSELGYFQTALAWLSTDQDLPLGFESYSIQNETYIGHVGGKAGFSTLLIYSEEKENGLFLHFNLEDTPQKSLGIASRILTIIDSSKE